MRKENVVLLGICVLIAAGIGVMVSYQMTPKAALDKWAASVTRRGTAIGPEDEQPAAAPKPAARKKMGSPVTVKQIADVAPVLLPEPVADKAAAPPAPQPELNDIPAGIDRSALLEKYPVPAIQTSTLRDGSLMELLVYQKKDAPLATYAQLENGAVTRVYAGIPARKLP